MIPAIKFQRGLKAEAREITPRRIAGAKRALLRQQEKMPLLREQIKAGQPAPEERLAEQDEWFKGYWQRLRDHEAKTWRRARRNVRAWPPKHQAGAIEYFNNGGWPKNATCFADTMHIYAKKNNLTWEGQI